MQDFYDENVALVVFEVFVDIFFLLDMVIIFLSAYLDPVDNGEVFRSPKMIATHYLKRGFIVDFLSVLPLFLRPLAMAITEKVSKTHNSIMIGLVTVFRLMKLLRLRKLSTLIRNLHQSIEIKNQLKRFFVLLLLVIFVHIQSCFLYLIVERD